MLGWWISVSRFESGALRAVRGDLEAILSALIKATGSDLVPQATDSDPRIATWQTRLHGRRWLDELVKNGRGARTSRGGYPDTYVILAGDFADRVAEGLPEERATWAAGPSDVLGESWLGRTTIDRETLAECEPGEWLLVTTFDES